MTTNAIDRYAAVCAAIRARAIEAARTGQPRPSPYMRSDYRTLWYVTYDEEKRRLAQTRHEACIACGAPLRLHFNGTRFLGCAYAQTTIRR